MLNAKWEQGEKVSNTHWATVKHEAEKLWDYAHKLSFEAAVLFNDR